MRCPECGTVVDESRWATDYATTHYNASDREHRLHVTEDGRLAAHRRPDSNQFCWGTRGVQ